MAIAYTTVEQNQVNAVSLFELTGITWQTYKTLIAEVGENRSWRLTYDRGILAFRMPLQEHEQAKIMIASLIEALADELEIEILQLGALRLEREDLTRAIEPDTCFYIQNELKVRGKKINLEEDPPPDMVIESNYTNSSIDKFSLYATLRVPELWKYRQEKLQVYQLINGEYELRNSSKAFPILPLAEVPNIIAQSKTIGQRAAVRLFRQHIRELL